MAVQPSSDDHSAEIQGRVRDYSRFLGMLKWGAIFSFILAMIVLVIISN